jgi:DNA polymerase IIIc chi subunit
MSKLSQEINFYQIDDVITKSLAPLLIKVLEDKKKTLIFCANNAKMKEIDDSLWTFGKNRFIPHLTILESDIEKISTWKRQPILLTNEEENKNEADYLVIIDEPSKPFVASFKKVFYFYEESAIADVKKFAKNLDKDVKIKSYKKVDAKWKEGAL